MRRGRTLLVLLAAALVPLLAPGAWLCEGAFPDVGMLVVVYVALHGGPAPAAWCGVALGLLASPWTVAPLGEQSFVLGLAGFTAGAIREALYRDRAAVQIGLVVALVLVVRLANAALVSAAAGSVAWDGASGGGGVLAGALEGTGDALPAALLSALATAVAAPPVFGVLDAVRLFRRRRVVTGV